MPVLTEVKYDHGSVAFGNKLYAIGRDLTQNCEVFDKVANRFVRIKQLQLSSFYCRYEDIEVFRIQNEIFAKICHRRKAGGENVYIYNTTTNEWTSMYVGMFRRPGRSSIIYKY